MYTYVHVQIMMILCSVAPGFVRLLPICTRQTLVAQHSSSWHKAFVSPEARSCPVCRTPFAHPGETAPGSSRRRRHHSPAHARPQGSVLSAGHVRPSGCPWLGKPPVLHQLVGHDLASRLQEGWLLRDEH
jgi:hypothetical protein